jgi:hypothetical protein
MGFTTRPALHLWNVKALEAIGNALGKFIKVDEVVLAASDKRIGRVLVEIDIHVGLSESLEIILERTPFSTVFGLFGYTF